MRCQKEEGQGREVGRQNHLQKSQDLEVNMTVPTIKTNTPVKSFLNSQMRSLNKTIKF